MSAALILGHVASWQAMYVPLVGLACTGLTLFLGRRVFGSRLARGGPETGSSSGERPDPYLLGSADDQRKWWRRPGHGAEVLFGDAGAETLSQTASIIDRSPGGLCLRTSGPVAVGSTLRVRARQAP